MKKAISIKRFSKGASLATLIVAVLIIVLGSWSLVQFKRLVNAAETYTVCRDAVEKIGTASDYLTEQCRLYVETGDPVYMGKYFIESKERRNREKSLDVIEKYYKDSEMYEYIYSARSKSMELMNTEYHAMKLMAESTDLPESEVPEEVRSYELTESEIALSPVEQKFRARQMLFDDNYEKARSEILGDVDKSNGSLSMYNSETVNRYRIAFERLYWLLLIATAAACIITIGIVLLNIKNVVIPVLRFDKCIIEGSDLPVEGAEELMTLAKTYNTVLQENMENQLLIKHQAEHDALTEILNRRSFERLLQFQNDSGNPYALFIIDVDRFKNFNDTLGHSTGDRVLKSVADCLKKSFRTTDHICRIGGDEFAVIMVDVTPDLKPVAVAKLSLLKELLDETCADIPRVTLSIGIAFSKEVPDDISIFNAADAVLYEVKENGRDGYRFYSQK